MDKYLFPQSLGLSCHKPACAEVLFRHPAPGEGAGTETHQPVSYQLSHSVSLSNKEPVLVHLGCCIRIPKTGWLINNRYLFSAVEAGKSKIKAPVDLVSGEPTF